jgi:Flp pilus assembly pilin Flp
MLMLDLETQSKTPAASPQSRRNLTADDKDGAAIKYALIAGGIGATVAGAVYSFGTTTAGLYQTVANLF